MFNTNTRKKSADNIVSLIIAFVLVILILAAGEFLIISGHDFGKGGSKPFTFDYGCDEIMDRYTETLSVETGDRYFWKFIDDPDINYNNYLGYIVFTRENSDAEKEEVETVYFNSSFHWDNACWNVYEMSCPQTIYILVDDNYLADSEMFARYMLSAAMKDCSADLLRSISKNNFSENNELKTKDVNIKWNDEMGIFSLTHRDPKKKQPAQRDKILGRDAASIGNFYEEMSGAAVAGGFAEYLSEDLGNMACFPETGRGRDDVYYVITKDGRDTGAYLTICADEIIMEDDYTGYTPSYEDSYPIGQMLLTFDPLEGAMTEDEFSAYCVALLRLYFDCSTEEAAEYVNAFVAEGHMFGDYKGHYYCDDYLIDYYGGCGSKYLSIVNNKSEF